MDDLTTPFGYRPYTRDPRTATGTQTAAPGSVGSGYIALVEAVAFKLARRQPPKHKRRLIALDVYQAPDMDAFLARFRAAWQSDHGQCTWFDTRQALKDAHLLGEELREFCGHDPVFGRVCDRNLTLFFDTQRWQLLVNAVTTALQESTESPVFVVGPGALLPPLRLYADTAVYAQVPRETVFLASESGHGRNLGDDQERDPWARYQRSYYVDWPVQNRHLFEVLPACDLLIDIHDAATPTFVEVSLLLAGMAFAAQRPFRVRSIFLPGVWGGQRLKRLIPQLPPDWPNCAWGFELLAPENTITFDVAGTPFQVAFELFVHFQAEQLLGRNNYRRFGAFFPIRFDFLDTIEGSNLSCQVHPTDAYINAHFREPFAQHEMYYILETRPGARVYLGLVESTSREAFLADVVRAQSQSIPFELTQHVNAFDASPGDLFLIPAGTVHCAGANNLVLEISATPYIYTFKIYDYLRLDLNGRPRPINYERAFELIDFSRTTEWVRTHLLSKPRCVAEGPGWRRLLLTDTELMFHAVERIEMRESYTDTTEVDGFHLLCVVQGNGVRVVREADRALLELTYAETAVIPAACGPYRLEWIGPAEVKLVKAYVRT